MYVTMAVSTSLPATACVQLLGIFILLPVIVGHRLFHWDEKPWDPEENMTAGELITSKGYPCEEHYVTTDDGFILNLQRIPHGRHQDTTGPVILLQHGLLGSSTNFLTNLANESLAYILADHGLDVWLSNSRGNTYSRNHTHLKPWQREFWEWTWDEMARYDLPAVLDHILKITGQSQLYYVGHSQGTTIAFAEMSQNLQMQKKIKLFFALAPVGRVGHVISPLRLLAPFVHKLEVLLGLFGDYEFLPNNKFFLELANGTCREDPVICQSALFLMAGFDFKNTNMISFQKYSVEANLHGNIGAKSRVPVYFAQSFCGTSTFNMLHFAQEIHSGKFQKFDYGNPAANVKHYNQRTPPEYYPGNVSLPVAIFSADRDWLADPKDVDWLTQLLPNVVLNKQLKGWNHLDFVTGMNAPKLCYTDILRLIKQHEVMI